MATIGNAPVFPTESVLPGNLQVTGNATISGTTNSVGALTENSNEVLNVTNTTHFTFDQWRLTTNAVGGATQTYILVNWERNDNASFGYIGTGMTHSSGTFTFPSTGIYKVVAVGLVSASNGDNQCGLYQQFTTDNSSYTITSYGYTGENATNYFSGAAYTSCLYDVTDVSLCKIQFFAYSLNSNTNVLVGNTGYNGTYITFERVGDT